MKMMQQLQLQVEELHSPICIPLTTMQADRVLEPASLEEILSSGCLSKISAEHKILGMEAFLLRKWSFAGNYQEILDSPLIAHAEAMISLKETYDAVIGIKNAGIPFAKIFEILGFQVFEIDYSCHKKQMTVPEIGASQLNELRNKKNVLLVDVDFLTGKTLTAVTSYLRSEGVKVGGAYIGLSKWQGYRNSEKVHVGHLTVNFETFWKKCGFTRQLRNSMPYKKGLIPRDLILYTGDPKLDENKINALTASRNIANYFLNEKHLLDARLK